MKDVFLLVFLIISQFCSAQIRVRNADVYEGDSNILFRDVINHITIDGIEDFTQYRVIIEGGMLRIVGENKVLVSNLNNDRATISVLNVSNGKEVYSAKFIVQDAGEPLVYLEEEHDETFSNKQTINRSRLEVKLPNPNYGGSYEVAHFEIGLIDSLGNLVMAPTFISGKYLGKSIYEQINSLPTGGRIYFSQVILTYANGGYRKYKDFVLQKK